MSNVTQICYPTWTPVDITITIIYTGCALGIMCSAILMLMILLHQIQFHFYTLPHVLSGLQSIEKKIEQLMPKEEVPSRKVLVV
jgi:hypothetical protein